MRILVVEDSEDQAGILKIYLAGQGHDVHIAASSEEALKLVKDNIYDVAVLDHCLPDIDGLSTLKTLRNMRCSDADTNACRVPVVIATAVDVTTADKIRTELNALQPAGIIRKPMVPSEILEEICQVRNPRRMKS